MKILLSFAIQEEVVEVSFPEHETISVITGIGKTLATMHLTEAILENKPDYVINIGTAGTLLHQIGDILVCQEFIDRDLRSTKIPGIAYQIESKHLLPPLPCFNKNLKLGIVNTGDNFVTQGEDIIGDVVDMEAFSEATVCQKFKVPFVSVKYVTDVIGNNSVAEWELKLASARKSLSAFFNHPVK